MWAQLVEVHPQMPTHSADPGSRRAEARQPLLAGLLAVALALSDCWGLLVLTASPSSRVAVHAGLFTEALLRA